MNDVLGAVLGIRLTLQGMEAVLRGVRQVGTELGLTSFLVDQAGKGFRTLGREVALAIGALMKAGEDETMRLTLQGVTQDASLAMDQIRFIRRESERGIFGKSDLFEAVQLFDQAHASLSRFLPLTEELALRSRKSLGAVAQYVTELAGGGTARLQGLLKPAGITVEQLRGAGLQVSDHYQTKNSAAEILAALEKITSKGSINGLLGGSFMAAYKGDLASIVDFLRSIGDGLIPVATPVLQFFGGLVRTITLLNDLTHGWALNVILAIVGFSAIGKILPLVIALADAMKLVAVWNTILAVFSWSNWASGIGYAIETIKDLVAVVRLLASWEAIADALAGNWVGLAAGAAVAAGVGVAWYVGNKSGSAPDAPSSSGTNGKRTPMRRASWEHLQQDTMARAMGA